MKKIVDNTIEEIYCDMCGTRVYSTIYSITASDGSCWHICDGYPTGHRHAFEMCEELKETNPQSCLDRARMLVILKRMDV
jgi:hypothetical protein